LGKYSDDERNAPCQLKHTERLVDPRRPPTQFSARTPNQTHGWSFYRALRWIIMSSRIHSARPLPIADSPESHDLLEAVPARSRTRRKEFTFERLAVSVRSVHTSTVTLKSAAFLALIGMTLLTILLAADFITTVLGVIRDVVPVMALLRSLVYRPCTFKTSGARGRARVR
jgi:hypothetical protein